MKKTIAPLFRGRQIQTFTPFANLRQWCGVREWGPSERLGVPKTPPQCTLCVPTFMRKKWYGPRVLPRTRPAGVHFLCCFFFQYIFAPYHGSYGAIAPLCGGPWANSFQNHYPPRFRSRCRRSFSAPIIAVRMHASFPMLRAPPLPAHPPLFTTGRAVCACPSHSTPPP